MTWSIRIRKFHRFVAPIFTLTVIANFVIMAVGKPPMWIVYSPLPFLFMLLPSGLHMLFLPYVTKRRNGRSSGGAEAALPQAR